MGRRRAVRDGLPRRRRDTIAIVGETGATLSHRRSIANSNRSTGPGAATGDGDATVQLNDYRQTRPRRRRWRRTVVLDSFELYDIPLDEAERITDDQAVGRIEAVWAFWQKQRDHPKYRSLVTQLVRSHDTRSKPLGTPPAGSSS